MEWSAVARTATARVVARAAQAAAAAASAHLNLIAIEEECATQIISLCRRSSPHQLGVVARDRSVVEVSDGRRRPSVRRSCLPILGLRPGSSQHCRVVLKQPREQIVDCKRLDLLLPARAVERDLTWRQICNRPTEH